MSGIAEHAVLLIKEAEVFRSSLLCVSSLI